MTKEEIELLIKTLSICTFVNFNEIVTNKQINLINKLIDLLEKLNSIPQRTIENLQVGDVVRVNRGGVGIVAYEINSKDDINWLKLLDKNVDKIVYPIIPHEFLKICKEFVA